MIIQQNVTILSASRYDFTNETGQQLSGTTVWYYDEAPVVEESRVGLVPVKASLPVAVFETLKSQKFPFQVVANVRVDLTRGKFKVESFEQRGK